MNSIQKVLITEQRNAVAAAFLNRPRVHNALDSTLRGALVEFWERVRDDDSVRVAIVAGVPGASFSSGRDLKETAHAYEMGKHGADWEFAERTGYPGEIKIGKPVIAAVDGHCLGAGLKIAIESDIRIATSAAKFGVPQVKVGRGTASPLYLRRTGLPEAVVNDMVFTGRSLTADEALRWGLISRIAPSAELIDEAWALAMIVAAGSPSVVRGAKFGLDLGLAELPPQLADPLWPVVTGMFGDTGDARLGAAAFASGEQASY